jgi:hypothetical protein
MEVHPPKTLISIPNPNAVRIVLELLIRKTSYSVPKLVIATVPAIKTQRCRYREYRLYFITGPPYWNPVLETSAYAYMLRRKNGSRAWSRSMQGQPTDFTGELVVGPSLTASVSL